jgi:hypothetical protein
MYLKPIAMNKALVAALFVLIVGALPAQAQTYRINVGCPTLGDPNIGNYTIDQLNQLCHNTGGTAQGGASTQPPAQAAESGAVLTCGQHRFLAAKARIDTSFVEGVASQAVVEAYCGGNVADDAIPGGSIEGGNTLEGYFRYERGYYTQWSGAKANICQTRYTGEAYVDNGRIMFHSGGHTWQGTISQNSYISITRDGVSPRPKNPTGISGPIYDAELFNGYCGAGYFRLIF